MTTRSPRHKHRSWRIDRPLCAVAGKQIHDTEAAAAAIVAMMNRKRARSGQLPYRGRPYACGDHWHVGRQDTRTCAECRANLGRHDHKLNCPKRGVA